MGFDFRPSEVKKAEERASRGALEAHQAHERTLKKTGEADDTEFWIAVCFENEDDLQSFAKMGGFFTQKPLSGVEFRQKVAKLAPKIALKSFPKKFSESRSRGNVEWLDGKARDNCEAAVMVLYSALEAMLEADEDPVPCFYVCFKDREDKHAFLAEHNLEKYGNKYIDGSSWLRAIKERIAG